jgi:hypothetical protein
MHRDVLAGRKFELASLTEFVVNEGLKYEMELPTYKMVLDKYTGFQELINAICCNAAKLQHKVYQIKEPLFSQGLYYYISSLILFFIFFKRSASNSSSPELNSKKLKIEPPYVFLKEKLSIWSNLVYFECSIIIIPSSLSVFSKINTIFQNLLIQGVRWIGKIMSKPALFLSKT